ncbi:MAG: 2-C-methyl-D-erythritol 4-phosphate cytidylyltransferase [Fusobacteriaceae bacterium]
MHCGDSEVDKFTLIVAAAGTGKRMSGRIKKQFLEYKEKPLYLNCILEADILDVLDKIIIVTSKEDLDTVKKHCIDYKIKTPVEIIAGGKERQNSIYEGIKIAEKGIIAVQDGARPFMKKEYLEQGKRFLELNKEIDGVVVGVKVKDTVKFIDAKGNVKSTPLRDELILAQTPQIFRSEILKRAYEQAFEEGFYGTDDSSLVEKLNGKIKIINGSYGNIKITTIEDLKYIDTKLGDDF